jgi:hydrogenase maturation factor
MCIDDPGIVVGLDADGAIVETAGRRRRASTFLVPDIRIGDPVTVAAGTIVDRLDPAEAREIRRILATARSAAAAQHALNPPPSPGGPGSPGEASVLDPSPRSQP